ncbi:MAG: dipeptidase [Armatimonadota bacterium]
MPNLKGVRDEAIELTHDALVTDMYTTSFMVALRALKAGAGSHEPGWLALPGEEWGGGRFADRFDLPKMKQGGLNVFGQSMLDQTATPAQFETQNEYELSASIGREHAHEIFWSEDWAEFEWPPEPWGHYTLQYPPRSPLTNPLIQWEILMREIDAIDDLMLIDCADDIVRAKEDGRVGVMLDCNCVQMIEDSLEMLSILFRLGFRQMLLARFSRNLVVDSWVQSRTMGGLTPFGAAVIREMNRIGMIIDVSHTSDAGIWDVIELSEDPVIASHCNAREVNFHPRNLTDEQIRAIAEKGGVIGLMTFFIGPGREYNDQQSWDVDDPRFETWLDHADHMIDLAGPEHIGWGSDGYLTMIGSPAELPKLTEGLMRRGHDEATIRGFLGENHLRVFREVVG